ncbi:hypothetical protein MVEN_01651200 [Mycena venus]|uniref:Uncharacterized protein n=1 Tax=Mycena venus TaxID=2733690 RepID=A0A8H7CP26_9AGAR|nr:hypothetical protein MVEN_01651200 [Mycena venus]
MWRPVDSERIPRGIIILLNTRNSEQALQHPFGSNDVGIRLWNCFSKALGDGISQSLDEQEEFSAMWRLASVGINSGQVSRDLFAALELALKVLSTAESPFPHITYSVVAFLKAMILRNRHYHRPRWVGEVSSWFDYDLFPADTAIQLPSEFCDTQRMDPILNEQWPTITNLQIQRVSEAYLNIAAEYLEHCVSDIFPYKATETLEKIANRGNMVFYAPVHPTHQMRLASSINDIFSAEGNKELQDGIVNWMCWSPYAEVNTEGEVKFHREKLNLWTAGRPSGTDLRPAWPWLDSPIARQKIENAFNDYEQRFTAHLSPVLRQGFNCWHSVSQPSSIADATEARLEPESVNGRGVGTQKDEVLDLIAYAEHLL